jgi:hypothetical protein
MLNVANYAFMLSVIMLSVVMLSVVAPIEAHSGALSGAVIRFWRRLK